MRHITTATVAAMVARGTNFGDGEEGTDVSGVERASERMTIM